MANGNGNGEKEVLRELWAQIDTDRKDILRGAADIMLRNLLAGREALSAEGGIDPVIFIEKSLKAHEFITAASTGAFAEGENAGELTVRLDRILLINGKFLYKDQQVEFDELALSEAAKKDAAQMKTEAENTAQADVIKIREYIKEALDAELGGLRDEVREMLRGDKDDRGSTIAFVAERLAGIGNARRGLLGYMEGGPMFTGAEYATRPEFIPSLRNGEIGFISGIVKTSSGAEPSDEALKRQSDPAHLLVEAEEKVILAENEAENYRAGLLMGATGEIFNAVFCNGKNIDDAKIEASSAYGLRLAASIAAERELIEKVRGGYTQGLVVDFAEQVTAQEVGLNKSIAEIMGDRGFQDRLGALTDGAAKQAEKRITEIAKMMRRGLVAAYQQIEENVARTLQLGLDSNGVEDVESARGLALQQLAVLELTREEIFPKQPPESGPRMFLGKASFVREELASDLLEGISIPTEYNVTGQDHRKDTGRKDTGLILVSNIQSRQVTFQPKIVTKRMQDPELQKLADEMVRAAVWKGIKQDFAAADGKIKGLHGALDFISKQYLWEEAKLSEAALGLKRLDEFGDRDEKAISADALSNSIPARRENLELARNVLFGMAMDKIDKGETFEEAGAIILLTECAATRERLTREEVSMDASTLLSKPGATMVLDSIRPGAAALAIIKGANGLE